MQKNKKALGMSISPGQHYNSRSRSRSPSFKKHNGYVKSFLNSRKFCGDSDSDREYNGKKDLELLWERKGSRESRSKSRDKDRYHWEKDYHRRPRSISRWEKKSNEHKLRNKDKLHKEDEKDSDSERSPVRGAIGASGSEIIGYKSQPPNNTIMIRGLATHITENEVRQDIILCGLMPKDIRLIRKKDTGASRGFAFVEFTTLAEAVRWMDMKQGILILQDSYRAIMQYSIPKDHCPGLDKAPSYKASADWFCIKCGAQNFKRRDNCFKCHASRMESEEGGSGSDEVCNYVTKTIMLRNLDALTTEDSVIQVFTSVIPEIANKISGVCIGRDPLTSTSRGICYLGTDSTIDALAVYSTLTCSTTPPLTIDGKTVFISYCKYNMGDTKRAHETALNAAFPNASQPSMYSLNDVDSLAEYSAARYSKNLTDYHRHFSYYKDYFTQQITAGNSITLHQDNQMDSANAAAAVAQSAIQQMNATKLYFETTQVSMPTGTDGKRYAIPDICKFVYDKNSGYHYDATTGLYYDPSSSYYWNSVTQKYLYFDNEKLTYLLAPVSSYEYSNSQQLIGALTPPGGKKQKVDKQDKVKVAKKVVKDMERWAKTLNQRKDTIMPRSNIEGSISTYSGGSADIGYSVLEKKNGVVAAAAAVPTTVVYKPDTSPPNSTNSTPLVAAYGESESSDDESHNTDNFDFLDFAKLICNLCKRQLTSAEALAKHAKLSDLHKKNFEAFKSGLKHKSPESSTASKVVYRDRAKERRMKYGDTDEPTPSKLKEKYLKSRELAEAPSVVASVAEPISAENVGNRLLQKMGWSEGQGLGKSNQGRTTIIQAEQRNSTIGLGNKVAYTAQAGESYKDCVKKMMYARYQELSEKS